jgi:hypothetical protein
MSDLFEQALQNPALLAEAATAFHRAAGSPVVGSSEAVQSLMERAAADPALKSSMAGALQQVAAQNGLAFNPEPSAQLVHSVGTIESAAQIVEFKAHKDNPTQTPISKPIALLFVGAALIFLPSVFSVDGQALS